VNKGGAGERVRKEFLVACTGLTLIGSGASTLMLSLIFLGVGWDSALFNLLLAVSVLSTIGLFAGFVGLINDGRWANWVLISSSLYIPIGFVVLKIEGFGPPRTFWWILLPLALAEIGIAGIAEARAA
jgi:hypothetical protein